MLFFYSTDTTKGGLQLTHINEIQNFSNNILVNTFIYMTYTRTQEGIHSYAMQCYVVFSLDISTYVYIYHFTQTILLHSTSHTKSLVLAIFISSCKPRLHTPWWTTRTLLVCFSDVTYVPSSHTKTNQHGLITKLYLALR